MSCPTSVELSAEDDKMDALIREASIPSLSTLFRRAKEAGVIGPVTVYGEGGGPNQFGPPAS